ncbi:hypothetical protein BHM03_00062084, partial [Ensete ventricosum]
MCSTLSIWVVKLARLDALVCLMNMTLSTGGSSRHALHTITSRMHLTHPTQGIQRRLEITGKRWLDVDGKFEGTGRSQLAGDLSDGDGSLRYGSLGFGVARDRDSLGDL